MTRLTPANLSERRTALLGIAVVFAVLSALVHLGIGLSEIVGGVTIVAVLFVVSGVVVFALLAALATGALVPPIAYLAGGALMIINLFAYVDVHALGLFESATGADLHDHGHGDHSHESDGHSHGDDGHSHENGHSHGENGHSHDDHSHDDHSHDDHSRNGPAHETVIDHLRQDPVALTTTVSETVAAVAFFTLYVLDR